MSLDTECFEKIGLFFQARNLPKMDIASQTDPFLVVYVKKKSPIARGQDGPLTLMGNTSVIRDSANPKWPDQLVIDYYFESIQEITIKIYDQDDKAALMDLNRHDFIGECSFLLTDLMCSKAHKLELKINGPKNMGYLEIRGEAVANTRDVFVGTFSGFKLSNKDGFFGRSDPFLQISRIYEDGSYGVVWKNDPIMNNLSPTWPQSRIPMMKLCNGDIERPLRIEIFDYEKSGAHKSMGIVETSVRGLLDSRGAQINVIEADKKLKSKSYVNSGTFSVSGCMIEEHPTFSDYVMGGCEVSLMVAIDFTGSNGDPLQSDSLHYIYRGANAPLNQYQQAIQSVGNIVEAYDSDKKFPVYGFGAKVKKADGSYSPAQHCFPVYGGGTEVQGVAGIMQAYTDCLNNVQLSGPTLFSPLLTEAANIASNFNVSQSNQKYLVLLILTDGAINDLSSTIEALVKASDLPLSVIIIGVGLADFSTMNELDGDGHMLRSGGSIAKRDIVQFVPFRDYATKGVMQLSSDVLAEVPSQFLAYMASKNIKPNKTAP